MAERKLVQVFISINSLDNNLAWKLEPRSSAPHRRMQAVKTLLDAGVPMGVQVAMRKAGLHRAWDTVLDTSRFVPPRVHSPQGELF
ncbi:hypothetical protein [Xanthomonas sp. NCPPB 2632]|uniref:hypothetical protein n=1 Tax=Xanthomonas sp. NCPPB 2632 TaxID=3240912 RepID=UPI003512BAB4